MEAYTSFAAVYDTFMDNIPYEEWEKYLKSLLYEYGVREGLASCSTAAVSPPRRWSRTYKTSSAK